MSEVMRKVLVVGLDGGDWALIQQWQDQLPNLQRLIWQGVGGRLQAAHPPMTCPSWPSFYTGKNPGRFGVFAFRQKQPNSYQERVINRTAIQAEPVWDLLARQGKRSIVVNLPVTYPPYPIEGVLVTGMLTPVTAEIWSFPEEVGAELNSLCHLYVVEPVMVPPDTTQEREALIATYLKALHKRTCAMRHLLASREWDFALVVYRATDVLAHFFWQYMDPHHPGYEPEAPLIFRQALLRAYQAADEGIGELLGVVPPETTVVVMSDHGFGPQRGTFAINEWLREKGFLALQRRPGSLRTFLARRNVTLRTVKEIWDRLGPLKRSYRVLPKTVRDQIVAAEWEATDQGLDWSRTVAYAGTDNGMQIYLNVKGREPQGIVSPGAEYEVLREEIIQALERDVAARTEPPHTVQVYRREEIYQGPYQDAAPDLAVYIEEGAWDHSRDFHGPPFRPFTSGPKSRSGSHRSQGMFILSGAGIRCREGTATAHIQDLAPTILHLLGLSIPDDFDGRPLLEYLSLERDPVYAAATDAEVNESGYSPSEEAAVEQHLRDLGYL